jgi:hypothetical protein
MTVPSCYIQKNNLHGKMRHCGGALLRSNEKPELHGNARFGNREREENSRIAGFANVRVAPNKGLTACVGTKNQFVTKPVRLSGRNPLFTAEIVAISVGVTG